MLIEFRNLGLKNVSFNLIKNLVNQTSKLIIDSNSKSHNDLTDLLLLGVNRVVIDERVGDSELGLAHALSDKILTKFVIEASSKRNSSYILDKIKRLRDLTNLIPKPVLLVTMEDGDLEKFWKAIPDKIKKEYEWWIAPSEGKVLKLSDKKWVKVWCISGDSVR